MVLTAIMGCGSPVADRTPSVTELVLTIVQPRMADHRVVDTGVEGMPVAQLAIDWSIDVNDPEALREASAVVVSGRVIGVERSFVEMGGFVITAYSVQVDEVYKGEVSSKIISVSLPGGTVPLGDYIVALDEMGLSQMKLGSKDLDRDGVPDGGPGEYQDPRSMDPATPITENWGTNPASASALAELQPDSWVFYLGGVDDGSYYGTAFNHALHYLKDGQVRSVHTEAERQAFPEVELYED